MAELLRASRSPRCRQDARRRAGRYLLVHLHGCAALGFAHTDQGREGAARSVWKPATSRLRSTQRGLTVCVAPRESAAIRR